MRRERYVAMGKRAIARRDLQRKSGRSGYDRERSIEQRLGRLAQSWSFPVTPCGERQVVENRKGVRVCAGGRDADASRLPEVYFAGPRSSPVPTRRDQRRPLLRAERHERRKDRLHAALAGLRDDRGARVAAHQLVVHQVIIAEEQRADRAVRDDAGQRLQHVLRRGGERDRLDQQQPIVDRLRAEELRQHAEDHVVLPRHVDGVARRVGLFPVAAELRLPAGQHVHPVIDLGLRRPGDVQGEERCLLLAEGLERRERDHALGEAVVHERDVVLQDGAVVVAPIGLHRGRVEAVERRLHAAAIGEHRAAPGLVRGIVHIGADDLRQRHGGVADRLDQLVDDRHLRRFERRLAGTVQDQPAAGAGEQPEDDRVLAQNVLLEDFRGVAIQLEHAGVERQHVLGRRFARRRRGLARDRRHVGGKILRSCRDGGAGQQQRGSVRRMLIFMIVPLVWPFARNDAYCPYRGQGHGSLQGRRIAP